MALARFEHDFTDDAGNLIGVAGTVTVRREDTGALAVPYSDRDGTTGLGNPFAVSDGQVAFHVIGGSYKITLTYGGETRELRYVAIGTAAEQDAEALGKAGYAFEFEAETTAAPSASSIRANNADLSAATKLFIDDETLGLSDISASLLALDPNGNLAKNRIRLTVGAVDAVFDVDGATDQTTYVELDVSNHDGSTSLNVGTCRVNIEWAGADIPDGTITSDKKTAATIAKDEGFASLSDFEASPIDYTELSAGDQIWIDNRPYTVTNSSEPVFNVSTNTDGYHKISSGGLKVRARPTNAGSIAIEALGCVAGAAGASDLANNTNHAQLAWDISSVDDVTIVHETGSIDEPYYVSGLTLRDKLSLHAERPVVYQLPAAEHGATGYFIDRDDDGNRLNRIRMKDIWFATATSSVSSAQDSNQDLAGMAYVGCEHGYFERVVFQGFGQGGAVMARAEAGSEGLGFTSTTQDGNYNTFVACRGAYCGKYRSDAEEQAIFVLKYKCNTNNFYATYVKGNPSAAAIAIKYGTNNNIYGGSGETLEYAVLLGELAGNNHVHGMRGEGVTAVVKGFAYTGTSDANGPLLWNTVNGVHLSSGTSEVDLDTGHNVFVSGTVRDPLRFRRDPPETNDGDGLIDVLGARTRPDQPFLIMATDDDGRTTNGATYIPKVRFQNNYIVPTAGTEIGSIEFENSDTSTNAAGVSAIIRAVMESSNGLTALAFWTGNGDSPSENFRIRQNGVLQAANLPTYADDTAAASLDAGDIYKTSTGELRIKL